MNTQIKHKFEIWIDLILTKSVCFAMHIKTQILITPLLDLMEYLLCNLLQLITLIAHSIHVVLFLGLVLNGGNLNRFLGNFFFLPDLDGCVWAGCLVLGWLEGAGLIRLIYRYWLYLGCWWCLSWGLVDNCLLISLHIGILLVVIGQGAFHWLILILRLSNTGFIFHFGVVINIRLALTILSLRAWINLVAAIVLFLVTHGTYFFEFNEFLQTLFTNI